MGALEFLLLQQEPVCLKAAAAASVNKLWSLTTLCPYSKTDPD